jgi:hypothetical protein
MTPVVPTGDPATWPLVGTFRRDLLATPLCEKPAPGLVGIICTRKDDHTGPCVALGMDYLVRAAGHRVGTGHPAQQGGRGRGGARLGPVLRRPGLRLQPPLQWRPPGA